MINKIGKLLVLFAVFSLTAVSCGGPLGSQSVAAGLVKTTNGGLDWTSANTVIVGEITKGKDKGKMETSQALSETDVSVIRFEKDNSQRMLAATLTDGLYFSENGGEEWKQILSKVSVYDVAFDPRDSNHIYAAGSAGGSGKILETKDKGNSWEEVYNEASKLNPVTAIALNPNNPAEIIAGLMSGNLVRSGDGGSSWSLVQNFADAIKQVSWQPSGMYVLTESKGLYASGISSSRFEHLSEYLINFSRNKTESLSSSSSDLPHVDLPQGNIRIFNQFVVSSSNNKLIYVAADNGLYKTLDGGATWDFVRLPLKNTNSTIQITSVTLGPEDSLVYVGAGNTVYKSLNSGESFQVQSIATDSVIQYILVDPNLAQVAYVGLNGGHK